MMNQPTASVGLELYLRTMRILWVAFLICVSLFFIISWVTRPTGLSNEISRGLHPMLYVLGALALSAVAASFIIKAGFYKRAARHRQPALMQAGFILAMALCESAVLLGLVDIFATRNDAAYLLFALGALGMVLHFPRRDQLLSAYPQSVM